MAKISSYRIFNSRRTRFRFRKIKRSDQPGPIFGISFLGDDVTGCGGGVWLSSSGGRLSENEEEEEIRRRAPFTPDKRPSGKTGNRR